MLIRFKKLQIKTSQIRESLTPFCRVGLILTFIVFILCTQRALLGTQTDTEIRNATVNPEIDYAREILPILAENCFACHGLDIKSRQADLRLDNRDDAVASGAIIPGDPDSSDLIDRIFSDDEYLIMPPPESHKTLTDKQKKLLKQWILQGGNYSEHWSFQKPEKPQLPTVQYSEWVINPIDQFILYELEKQQLQPAEPLDSAKFFRRLHLDITGLIPHPQETRQFVVDFRDHGEEAVSNWIDKLMQRPQWGEHRGRYWLDAARYGDTHGMHFDNYREIWPYRDWVIKAFNANMRFDEFMVQQIAGDLLPEPTTDQLIATGFQRCNITTNEGGTIEEENLALYAADRVQTLGWVFLGLTTNCAQCHDHKFDPLTTEEYYQLAAFFRNTTQRGLDGNNKAGNSSVIVLPVENDAQRWESLPDEIAQSKTKLDGLLLKTREKLPQILTQQAQELEVQSGLRNRLVVDAPLNDGTGTEVVCRVGTSLIGVGNVGWDEAGRSGKVAKINPQSYFLIGERGDWDVDDSFSYGAWIKPSSNNQSGAILARMDTNQDFRGWDLMQSNRKLSVHLIDSWPQQAIKVTTASDVLSADRWQHLFVTYDGSRKPEGIKIFVDGLSQPTVVNNNQVKADYNLRTSTPTRVGMRRSDQFWNGAIEQVKLFDRQLQGQEVAALVWADELDLVSGHQIESISDQHQHRLIRLYLSLADSTFIDLRNSIDAMEAELTAIRNRSPITHVQKEQADRMPMTNILMRGEYDRVGPEVTAGTPAFLHPFPESQPTNRLGLAYWLTEPDNPLTARVTVNRFWLEIFGEGFVFTAEDFGIVGAQPTNQALLDWLAIEFQESGWDVRHIYKLLLSSNTYRQAAVTSPEKRDRDWDNQWFSRGPRFRMDAEMIRDMALKASGLLSPSMHGPPVRPYQPGNIWDVVGLPEGNTRKYVQDQGEKLYRRSIYTFWKRMAHPPNLEIFNAPSREVCSVKRERTNTPLQALVLLNDTVFVEAARNLAQRVSLAELNSNEARLQWIAEHVIARQLSQSEMNILQSDLQFYLEHYREHPSEATALLSIGESPIDSTFAEPELAAWTMLSQQFLNLDEAINK